MYAVNPYLLFKKNIYSLHGKSTNLQEDQKKMNIGGIGKMIF